MKDRLRENLLDTWKEGEINPVEWLEKRRESVMDLVECGVPSALELWKRLDEEIVFFLKATNLKVEVGPDPIKWESIPDYGAHMTREEFTRHCVDGMFIDDDGFGEYATDLQVSDIKVHPSDVRGGLWDERFTHVVWYNK